MFVETEDYNSAVFCPDGDFSCKMHKGKIMDENENVFDYEAYIKFNKDGESLIDVGYEQDVPRESIVKAIANLLFTVAEIPKEQVAPFTAKIVQILAMSPHYPQLREQQKPSGPKLIVPDKPKIITPSDF